MDADYPPFDDDAVDQCVLCGETFGEDNWSLGLIHTEVPVVNIETGVRHETIIETDGGDKLAHPECYSERKAEIAREEHSTLDQFE